jgi:5-formyltetrahydrofolate cyclo-ligase
VLRFFSAGKRVALYPPFDSELHTGALIAAARRRGVRMPALDPDITSMA